MRMGAAMSALQEMAQDMEGNLESMPTPAEKNFMKAVRPAIYLVTFVSLTLRGVLPVCL